MAELPPLKYGKVVGRFLANIIDGADVGDLPEFPPLAGTLTFTAEAPKILVVAANPPATYVQLPQHYVVSLNQFGYITWRGTPGVRLVAPNADTNPAQWSWRVSFDLSYDGDRIPLEPFSFIVPEYVPGPDPDHPDIGSTGLVDLTTVSPVPATPGAGIVRGPQGEGLQIDRRVATYGDLPATPAEGDGAQYVLASDGLLYVYRTATGWMPNGQGVVIRGATGPTGPTGEAGPANSLAIGTVSTGAPGSSASATITGTAPSQTLSLSIPRGDTGNTGPAAPDATISDKGIVQLAGVLAGNATSPAFSSAAFGTTSSTAARGDDPRLSDARTPTAGGQVYDFTIKSHANARTTGTGNVIPEGVRIERAISIQAVTFRGETAGTGNLVVELRRNGSTTGMPAAATIPAANHATDTVVTAGGPWPVAAGERLTINITTADSPAGNGLQVSIKAVTT
uniref:hypothetical protein n=1 Tax=Nocardia suismassiliense TaxID=2077092 RepID=UPI003F496D31